MIMVVLHVAVEFYDAVVDRLIYLGHEFTLLVDTGLVLINGSSKLVVINERRPAYNPGLHTAVAASATAPSGTASAKKSGNAFASAFSPL